MIRLGALGDVVRTLPTVAGLRERFPTAELTWMVEAKAAGVLKGRSEIDRVWIFPREEFAAWLGAGNVVALLRETFRLRRSLRQARFDVVLDFHGILKSGVLSWLAGAPVRMGFARAHTREFSWLFSNQRISVGASPVSRFERNAALVGPLGVKSQALKKFRLGCDEAALERVDEWLDGRRRFAILHAGSSPATPYKRLPAETYVKVAMRLKESLGLHSILTFGPGGEEREEALAIARASRGTASLAPETTRFANLAALLARAELFIGGDTGPLHVASLVGTPVVQLIGPTHPVENAPFSGTPSRSLRLGLSCSPCRSGCAQASCMTGLTSDEIVDAARELICPGDVRPNVKRAGSTTALAQSAARS